MKATGVLAWLALLATPLASGLALEFGDSGPLTADEGPTEFPTTIHLECEEVRSAASSQTESYAEVRMDWAPQVKGIFVEGPTTIIIPTGECMTDPTGNISHQEIFFMSATREVEGLVTHQVTSMATLVATELYEEQSTQEDLFVTVGFYDAVKLVIENPIQRIAPAGTATFHCQITNEGNADARMVFDVQDIDPSLHVVLPEPFIVPTPNGGGDNTVEFNVTISHDGSGAGFENDLMGAVFRVTPQADLDSSQVGEPVTGSILVRVRGINQATPDVTTPAVIAAVIAAALVASRRRA